MTTFYIALPWIFLFLSAIVEMRLENEAATSSVMLGLALMVLALVSFGAKLGSLT